MADYTVENEKNYAAECIRAPEELIEFDALDNLKGVSWAGYTILVPNEYSGRKLVVFPAESQLSETVAYENNLYAKKDKNKDPEDKGYLGNNRRVRAIRLRGVPSNALALPAELFGDPPVGTVFDTYNGVEVCRKYVLPVKESTSGKRVEKLWRRVEDKWLPEHYETGQYLREGYKIGPDDFVTITQKLHGTSVRIANTIVKRKLPWYEKLAQKLGITVRETEYAVVGGSRHAIKDPDNPYQSHYYEEDIWTHAAQRFGSVIPENVVLYGELIGWVPGTETPIQKGYTYRIPRGQYELYVYRVAIVTESGGLYDLSWNGVREFCKERGLKHVPELWNGFNAFINPDDWMDRRFFDARYEDHYIDLPLPLASESPVDEGVVIRKDGIVPIALKLKGPKFYEYETKTMDEDEDA